MSPFSHRELSLAFTPLVLLVGAIACTTASAPVDTQHSGGTVAIGGSITTTAVGGGSPSGGSAQSGLGGTTAASGGGTSATGGTVAVTVGGTTGSGGTKTRVPAEPTTRADRSQPSEMAAHRR